MANRALSLTQILRALLVIALSTMVQGVEMLPSSRNGRAAGCSSSFPESQCDVKHAPQLLGASSSYVFNVSIVIKQSVNDQSEFLRLSKDSTSDIEKIQALEAVSTDNNTCNYQLRQPAARDLAHPYCSWRYDCSYNARKIPQYLCRAQCSETCLHCPQGYTCKPVLYKVPVLTLNSEFHQCHPFLETVIDHTVQWTWTQEVIPVSCACQKTTASDCQGP